MSIGAVLQIDSEALKPIIEAAVKETVAQIEATRARLPAGQLAYTEQQAASLLDLQPHVLRDERLRGRISASQIVGRRVRYLHDDLLQYLLGRRVKGDN